MQTFWSLVCHQEFLSLANKKRNIKTSDDEHETSRDDNGNGGDKGDVRPQSNEQIMEVCVQLMCSVQAS